VAASNRQWQTDTLFQDQSEQENGKTILLSVHWLSTFELLDNKYVSIPLYQLQYLGGDINF
jgi:hypothetical protein